MTTQTTTEKDTAIDKALSILDCFIPYNTELGNADITALTGYHRATVSRMIKTLEKHGFLYQNQQTKKYRLGSKIPQLYAAVSDSLSTTLTTAAQPFLLRLRNETAETVVMDTLTKDSIIPSLVFRGKGPIFFDLPLGSPVPWNTSPGLKSILAFSDDAVREHFFTQPMMALTKTSVTDLIQYKAELIQIRQSGYALSQDEPTVGSANISVPIFDDKNKPIASISIAGLKERLLENKEFFVRSIRKTAAEISDSINMR